MSKLLLQNCETFSLKPKDESPPPPSRNSWLQPEFCGGVESFPHPVASLPEGQDVHLWAGDLDCTPKELGERAALLNADERVTADRFRSELHRNRCISSRALLRMILGQYLRCKPQNLSLKYSKFGKPVLAGAGQVHFNVSHSAGRFVLAIAEKPVGIDIEVGRTTLPDDLRELESLGNLVFSEAEKRAWNLLPVHTRAQAFLNLWTRKEALLKGIGLGITEHLKDVSVFFDNGERARVPLSLTSDSWTVTTIQEGSAVTSVALPFNPLRIARRNWTR